jgi:hypothetical protein
MPMYMDIHEVSGATAEDVARAHDADVATQSKYGVAYHKYWFNESRGKIFCLCSAPSSEAAVTVHREAHGLVASKIIEVAPEVAEGFLGGGEVNAGGAALVPGGAAGGREVKHTGDGIMAVFVSATAAVRCAINVHQSLAQHRSAHPDQPLKVRVGVAAGEPIEHHDDLFGSTVQLAARLCAHAEPEQILVSNAVAELCIGKALPFTDVGRIPLKGFDQPVHVHAVGFAATA